MDESVNEFSIKPTERNISSGFVGTIICWTFGLAACAFAIAFSFAGSFQTKAVGMIFLLAGAVICGWARTSSPKWKLRLSAMCISGGLILLLSEGLLRMLTPYPVNLQSNMVPHPQLGYVLDPEMADVDVNGFRNAEVPQEVDIVTIGDSHTQGFNVTSDQSWPGQLARQLDQSVYNMGVGGYGPLQYKTLVINALKMKPRHVVLGLYLGNDLADAVQGIGKRHTENAVDNSFRHSIKYHTAVGSMATQLIRKSAIGRPAGFGINHPQNPTYVAARRIESLAKSLDLSDVAIAAALKQTAEMLVAANQQCLQQGTTLTVMLIPTRESVYFENQKNRATELSGTLELVANRELETRTWLASVLTNQKVAFVDILPAMAAALDAKPEVYPSHDEGHPLAGGYATYAASVSQKLSQVTRTSTN